jgi:hypothetical protein
MDKSTGIDIPQAASFRRHPYRQNERFGDFFRHHQSEAAVQGINKINRLSQIAATQATRSGDL